MEGKTGELRNYWFWLFFQSLEEREKSIVKFQKYRSTLFDVLARLGTFFSDEEFYLTLFPLLYWGPYCDSKLGWNLCEAIGLGLPIGNTFKNIFCIRRPSSPPVWQYHTSNEEHEFAFPSTHAILAASVSLVIAIHHLFNYDYSHYGVAVFYWFLFFVLWSMMISFSRVYMGAHSFQDIALGSVIGIVFGIVLALSLEFYHPTMAEGGWFVKIASTFLLLTFLHSHPINKDSRLNFHLSEGTFDYSAPVLGLALGGILSRSWYTPVKEECLSDINMYLVVRYVVGVPFSIFIYTFCRMMLPRLIEPVMKYLNVQAHYIQYSEFPKYLSKGIREHLHSHPQNNIQQTENTDLKTNPHQTNGISHSDESDPPKNPEYLIAWVRIYSKFLQYVILTYTIAVVVPMLTGLFL